MNATMLCTDFDKNFSPKLDGGDENGLAKQCNLGKDSSGAAQVWTSSELFKGLPPLLCSLLPGELKSIEWDSGTILSSLWCYI